MIKVAMETKINIAQGNVIFSASNLGKGFILIMLAIIFYSKNEILSVVITIVGIRIFIYQFIELWFSKTIFKKDGLLRLSCLGYSFNLNEEKSFLVIENTVNISHTGTKHPTLNIYRNPSSIIKKIFKNKIKLYEVKRDNIERIKAEARVISDTFGIRFIDDFEFDELF